MKKVREVRRNEKRKEKKKMVGRKQVRKCGKGAEGSD